MFAKTREKSEKTHFAALGEQPPYGSTEPKSVSLTGAHSLKKTKNPYNEKSVETSKKTWKLFAFFLGEQPPLREAAFGSPALTPRGELP